VPKLGNISSEENENTAPEELCHLRKYSHQHEMEGNRAVSQLVHLGKQ